MSKKKFIVRSNEVVFYSQIKEDFIILKKDNDNFIEAYTYLISTPEEKFEEEEFLKVFVTPEEKLKNYSKGTIEKKEDSFICEDKKIPENLAQKIIVLKQKGFDFKHFELFWQNCKKNPNPKSIERLFDFLEKQNLTITEDGHFIAYKSVRKDFKDWHTGKLDNSIGNVVSMQREEVSFNPEVSCSFGLHCGSFNYASTFNSPCRIVLVKVNPANVVSVPYDSCSQKIRVCEYLVLKEFMEKEPIETKVVTGKGEEKEKDLPLPSELLNKSNTKWEKWEDETLLKLKKKGFTWAKISEKILRTPESCRKRFKRL